MQRWLAVCVLEGATPMTKSARAATGADKEIAVIFALRPPTAIGVVAAHFGSPGHVCFTARSFLKVYKSSE